MTVPAKNQVVVYTTPQNGPKNKKKKRAPRGPIRNLVVLRKPKKANRPRINASGAMRQFQLALRNPFSPDALGVRAIDAICYPTTVSHLRFKQTCTTTAGGAFQAVLLPFLHANMILAAGTTTGAPGVYGANTAVSYVTSGVTLKNSFTNLRVVAWGARIILTDSNLNAKGTYTLAPVMLGSVVPGESVLQTNAAANTAAICAAFGVPVPAETAASMPGAIAVNAQDLMAKGELLARGVMYNASAYDMKCVSGSSTAWNGTLYCVPGQGLYNTVGPSFTNVETNNLAEARGQIGYLLSVNNAPASTAEFQIEFIYHVEGIPQPSQGVVMTSTPSPSGSTNLIERVLATIHTAGDYFALGTGLMGKLGDLGTKMYQFQKMRNKMRY